ncbi:MAG: M24 family metallopeptidase [Parachlamydia sp.]|nr:M24 family metallopeptidase [Parachlamydia sp.]
MKKGTTEIQRNLAEWGVDGWLLYDFRRSNELACQFLSIRSEQLLTRRFFYWIPTQGTPVKIVQAIEDKVLHHLPGETVRYRTWQELEAALKQVLQGAKRVAMEYSPRNALPAISRVDAGTIELVRGNGVEVVSSANLLQVPLHEDQVRSHLEAAEALDATAEETWEWIARSLEAGRALTEYEVQQFILERFGFRDCVSDDPPICAVNEHSANPHYAPQMENSSIIQKGDFILIDLWCRKKGEGSVYADITRVAVAAEECTERQREVFSIVREAQEAATQLVKECFRDKRPLMGWEVDQAARDVIHRAGYGDYFIHRTGHNIAERDHGPGTHMDNFETRDDRLVTPMSCFSIEPGIYLPGEFGVRLEYDILVHEDGQSEVTGGVQDQIVRLLAHV